MGPSFKVVFAKKVLAGPVNSAQDPLYVKHKCKLAVFQFYPHTQMQMCVLEKPIFQIQKTCKILWGG